MVIELAVRGSVSHGAEESVLIVPSGPEQSGNLITLKEV